MGMFRAIALCIAFALAGVLPVAAFEVITVPEDVNAVNLTGVVDIVPGQDGKVQLSTAPGEDGIIRRIEVLSGCWSRPSSACRVPASSVQTSATSASRR